MVKKTIICILIVFLFFSIGCWNRKEPEDLALVIAVGFDIQENGDLEVIVRVADPQAQVGGEGGGGGNNEKNVLVFSATGRTAFEAAKNLASNVSREINFTHIGTILISEELARGGIHHILDFMDRERQFRLLSRPLIVDGDVRELMEIDFPLEEIGGRVVRQQLETVGEQRATARVMTIRELYIVLTQPGWDLFLPRAMILLKEEEAEEEREAAEAEEEEDEAEGAEAEEEAGEVLENEPLHISGMAVFKRDKMVGWANQKETRGFNWATNDINRVIYVLKSSVDDSRPTIDILPTEEDLITVEIFQGSTNRKARVDGKKVVITLHVKADGRIQETTEDADWLASESEFTKSLNRRLAQAIRNDIEAALDKMQKELKVDTFGFGNLLYKTLPQEWKRLEDHWDEIYPEVEVEIFVDATVRRTGLIKNPLKIR